MLPRTPPKTISQPDKSLDKRSDIYNEAFPIQITYKINEIVCKIFRFADSFCKKAPILLLLPHI